MFAQAPFAKESLTAGLAPDIPVDRVKLTLEEQGVPSRRIAWHDKKERQGDSSQVLASRLSALKQQAKPKSIFSQTPHPLSRHLGSMELDQELPSSWSGEASKQGRSCAISCIEGMWAQGAAFADAAPGAMRSFALACRYLSEAKVRNTFLEFPEDREEIAGHCLRKCSSEPHWLSPASMRKKARGLDADGGTPDLRHPAPVEEHASEAENGLGQGGGSSGHTCGTGAVGKLPAETKRQAHAAGLCKPCRFFTMREEGCKHGDACPFCHICSCDAVLADMKKAGDGLATENW